MRKFILATIISLTLLLVVGGSYALASECVVVNKPDGAGNFGDIIVNVSEPGPPVVTYPTNPGGQTAGGFVDVWLDFDGDGTGDQQIQDDTFALPASTALDADPAPHLPHVAMESAGPGKGIDENH